MNTFNDCRTSRGIWREMALMRRPCAALVALGLLLLVSAMARASVNKSASETFTNKENSDLWKLRYKFGVPYDTRNDYWMESTDTWLENESCCRTGYCEYDENDDGEAWQGRMEWTDCSLGYNESTTIQVEVELNENASLSIYDVEGEHSPAFKALPAISFHCENLAKDPVTGRFSVDYVFENIDPNTAVNMHAVKVYILAHWYGPTRQRQYLNNPVGTPFETPFVSFLSQYALLPGEARVLTISNIPNDQKSFLYVAGMVTYTLDNYGESSMAYIHGHELLPGLAADINGDRIVNLVDLARLAAEWLEDYRIPQ